MVDFKKKLGKKIIEKKLNPIEIYDSLDRISETGPLRPAQEFILNEWYSNRINTKNQIVKLLQIPELLTPHSGDVDPPSDFKEHIVFKYG